MMQMKFKPRTGFMQRVSQYVIFAVRAWGGMGGACIVGLMALTALDAVMRYCFNMPIVWGYDISTYMMGACVFFGAVYTELHDGHVNVSVIISILSEKGRIVVNLILRIIMLAICIIMTWSCWIRTVTSIKTGSATTGIVRIPRYPLEGILFLGMAIFSIFLIVKIYGYIDKIWVKRTTRG